MPKPVKAQLVLYNELEYDDTPEDVVAGSINCWLDTDTGLAYCDQNCTVPVSDLDFECPTSVSFSFLVDGKKWTKD